MSGGSHEGRPGTVLGRPCKLGLTRCLEDPMRDVPGQSWDIPTNWGDLLSGGSHEGHPRTVLGHPCKLGDLISTLSQEVHLKTS